MILATNTSTPQFSMALMKENGIIQAEYFMSSESKNFRGFMPALDFLMTTSNVEPHRVRVFIVAAGPGSFTGLRVGLSAAKGMAQGLHVPIIGVSSLEAMANQLPYTNYPICPVIDSRKGEVFAALFKWHENQRIVRIKEDASLRLKDLPAIIEGTTVFLGNNLVTQGQMIRDILGQKALLAPPHLWNLKASAVGVLGLKRFAQSDFDNLQELVPTYLRAPDIRPNPFPPLSGDLPASN